MRVQLKICGLSTEETLDAAIAAGADYLGLVHFPKSPRHVEAARAAALARHVRDRVPVVLLTVDMADASLAELIDLVRPDVLQLHGAESPEQVHALRARHGAEIWKTASVSDAADVAASLAYCGVADRLLFDARPPHDASRPGGNGEAFDWSLLADGGVPTNFVLAGGLTATNVGRAIAVARPAIVDVSSGVESAPGVKDFAAIRAFAEAVRAASAEPVRRAS